MAYRRRSKTRRAVGYWSLRNAHFVPREAYEFSKLTAKYPALKRIVTERGFQWQAFMVEARAKGWDSEFKRRVEWNRSIIDFYSHRRYATRGGERRAITWLIKKDRKGRTLRQPRISPWDYYDYTFERLPEEQRWDTPRSARLQKQGDVQVSKIQVRRWIEDLRKSRDRATTSSDKARFQRQIDNLGSTLKTRR